MRLFSVRNTLVASAIGLFGLIGSVAAQDVSEEYRECLRAQRQMQREYNQYARSGGRSNYRDWLRSQHRAQRECSEYQAAAQNPYGRTVYNNGNGYGWGYGRANTNQGYYRVRRSNGGYYQTDQRGLEMLRQAVNAGYQQGYQQGQMDRQYGRRGSYYGSDVYSSGSYGHDPYVDRSQYQYYFQQGFQRGYQDGYNSRSQYGYRSNNSMNILGTILNQILRIGQ